MSSGCQPEAVCVSPVRWPLGRKRHRTAQALGLGNPRDQAAGHGISTPPPELFVLRHLDLWGTPGGCAVQSGGTTTGRPDRAAHGMLQTEQAPRRPVPGISIESTVFAGLGGQVEESGDGRADAGL